ncbi:unnamed protein product [Linum trigynum]|uniref:Reverse transcriptase domain-containing protein n=1 Tax=Linum trigynum TaxID=586398 RepID=A0AAV2FTQ9_9ROSI
MKRLSSVLPKLVTHNQHASVRGRHISEATLIANELVDSRRKCKKPGLMFKLDIEKVFDNVSWECMFGVMERLGFPNKWQQWIKGDLCSPMTSVLVNGEAYGYFRASKGVRQGDPLSPGLFVLVMDVLSFMISKLRGVNGISGFFMDENSGRGEVTHLLFADDSLIFCDASADQVLNLLATLVCFQSVTGLKINLDKSMMFTVGDVPEPSFLAAIFGCNWSSEPTKYLGLPLGDRPNSISIWNPVISKYHNRLQGWRSRFLSLGARIVLNQSILNSLSVYHFSLLKAPKTVLNTMEKIQRKFLWCGGQQESKFHLIRWDTCKASKQRGGLGVVDLESFNMALLGKWLWKYATERDSWWRQLIGVKYASTVSEWKTKKSVEGFSSSVWANISKVGELFWQGASIEPGSGSAVSLWHDVWIPGFLLASSFPRAAAAAAHPDASLLDSFSRSGDDLVCEISFSVSLRGGAEFERVGCIEKVIANSHRITNSPSRMVWNPNADCMFSVRSFYRFLVDGKFDGNENFKYKSIWKSMIPTKICGFLWLVWHKKILTLDNLKKRGMQLASRCVLCYKNEESINHIMVECPYTRRVWDEVLRNITCPDLSSGDITSIIDHYGPNIEGVEIWFAACVIHAICWFVWKERNQRIFQESCCPHFTVIRKITRNIVHWMVAHKKIDEQQGVRFIQDRFRSWGATVG